MNKQADIKQYALGLLDLAKRFLLEDGDLDAGAFIVAADDQILRPLELQDETTKLACCTRIVEEARSKGALAIVTVFLARSKDFNQNSFLQDTYQWGDIQTTDNERCILITVSGPGIKNWAAALPFSNDGKTFDFREIIEFADGVDLGLFPGWSEQIKNPRVS